MFLNNDIFCQVLLFVFKNTPTIFSQIILVYKCLRTDPGREVFSNYPSFNLKSSRFFQGTEGDCSKWIEYKEQREKVLVFSNCSFNSISQNPRVHFKCSLTMSVITFKIPKDQLKSQNLLEVLI